MAVDDSMTGNYFVRFTDLGTAEIMDGSREFPARVIEVDVENVVKREWVRDVCAMVKREDLGAYVLDTFPAVTPRVEPVRSRKTLPLDTVVKLRGGRRKYVVSSFDRFGGHALTALSGGVKGSGPSGVYVEEMEVLDGEPVCFVGAMASKLKAKHESYKGMHAWSERERAKEAK
jgi:hypothetical protein